MGRSVLEAPREKGEEIGHKIANALANVGGMTPEGVAALRAYIEAQRDLVEHAGRVRCLLGLVLEQLGKNTIK